MDKSQNNGRTTKRIAGVSALFLGIGLLALSAPAIQKRYQAYIQAPEAPYRHEPLNELPPLGERNSKSFYGRTISVIQIPPSTNPNSPDSRNGWIIGTPEEMKARGIDTEPTARFKKPSLPFPSSTTVWHIDTHPGQSLADVTFYDDSGDERYKIIKINDLADRPVADIYIDGEPVRIMIPLGIYRTSMSMGRNWEGEDTEFGPYGSYIDLNVLTLSQNSQQTTYRNSIVTAAKALP